MGYSKAPDQLQNSTGPIGHSHTMTHIGACRAMHCATRDDGMMKHAIFSNYMATFNF